MTDPATFAIVTATDAATEDLAIGLCRSLGSLARDLHVIDIGMTPSARTWFTTRGGHDRDDFTAMVLRPRLPQLVDARMLLRIDADCGVQDAAAIDTVRRDALAVRQHAIATLRASAAWRVTAPLRALKRSCDAFLPAGTRALPLPRNRLAWQR